MMMGSRRAAIRDILVGICRKYEFSKKNKSLRILLLLALAKLQFKQKEEFLKIFGQHFEKVGIQQKNPLRFLSLLAFGGSQNLAEEEEEIEILSFDSWRNICSCNLLLLLKL
jgi:hypothetical protein